MRFLLLYLTSFLILLHLFTTTYGNTQYLFNHISTENGLSNNTVLNIAQDKHGRIWFATYDGLTYFDGLKYHTIRHVPKPLGNTIPSGKAEQIVVDSAGSVWILFENNIVTRLTDLQGGCKTYTELSGKFNSKIKVHLSLSGDGSLLIVNKKQCYKHIQTKDMFQPVANCPNGKREKTIAEIQDKLREQWSDVEVYSYYESADTKDIWVATLNQGLFRVPEGNYTKAINYCVGSGSSNCISSNEIYCVFVDKSGRVWAGTKDGGAIQGHVSKTAFKTYVPEQNLKQPYTGGAIRAILKSKDGKLWLGTYNSGIHVYDKGKTRNIRLSKGQKSEKWDWIRCIFQSSDNYIWVGSYAGLCRIDPETGEKKYYSPGTNDKTITKGRIYSIAEEPGGNLFIGEWGSLDYFNRKKGTFIRIDSLRSLKNKNIRKLMLDSRGKLWVGTETSGVFVLNTVNFAVLQNFKHSSQGSSSINSNSIFEIYEGKEGKVWLGNFGGLNSIDKKGKIENHISINEKLPSTLVYRIFGGQDNMLWCSTAKGIVKLSDAGVRIYDKSDGNFVSEFSEGAGFQDSCGTLYFGGVDGVSYFHPDSITVSYLVPDVVIESIEVNGKRLKNLNPFNQNKVGHQFSSWEDNIFFEIKSISAHCSQKNKIAWKLVPFDDGFQTKSGAICKAQYSDLPYGTYQLIVKSANADGIWSDEKQVFSFEIEKPFWAKYSFIGSGLLLFVLVTLFVLRFRFAQIKKKNLQLEALVSKRTSKIENQKRALERVNRALEDQNAEVSAQRDQILAQRDHLIEMHKKLEEMNKLKQKFFMNISHDIRTPLSLIYGPINEMLKGENVPSELLPKLNRIQSNANFMIQLLDQVLDEKKFETGGMQIVLTQGDLVQESKTIVNSFSDQAKHSEIDLQFNSNRESYHHRFDYEKLKHILLNLIANAVKFTPQGGFITCKLNFTEQFFEIVVEDSGIGIPKNSIKHIFDRYYQVGKSSKKEKIGSGIGLSLVKDYIDLLEGSIEVDSVEGQGSQFRVKLPLKSLSETSPLISPKENQINEHADVNGSGKINNESNKDIVLLVEDNSELREYLKEILSKHYEVVALENGKEALNFLKQNNFVKLILSDWMMPEMDGIELCKAIKKKARYSTIPFVLLTALSDTNNQKEGYFAGIDEFIPKPFDPDLLVLKISNLLSRKEELSKAVKTEQQLHPENVEVKSYDEKLIDRLKEVVEKEISNVDFGQSELAAQLGMSQTQLYRKMKLLVKLLPNEFIRTTRIKRAAQLLEKEGLNINEVSDMVGFKDPKYFSRCFSKEIGMSPTKYRDEIQRKRRDAVE